MPATPPVPWNTLQDFSSCVFPQGLPPGLAVQWREAGVDLRSSIVEAHPLEVWRRCVELSASWVFPTEPPQRAWRLLGERFGAIAIERMKSTTLGSAQFTMYRMLGLRQAFIGLKPIWQLHRFGQVLTPLQLPGESSGGVEVYFNETNDTLRHFTAGRVFALLHAFGAQEPRVDLRSTDARGCTLCMSWRAPERGPQRGGGP